MGKEFCVIPAGLVIKYYLRYFVNPIACLLVLRIGFLACSGNALESANVLVHTLAYAVS